MINPSFSKSDFWAASWERHIKKYLSAHPRCGIWLNYYFSEKLLTFLECAGGSCRDSRYLFQKNRKSKGSDFDQKTINYVNEKYSASGFVVVNEDSFVLSFASDSFDVVFHNGFWVCFDDDQKVLSLLNEQIRVARRYAVALVHNKMNQGLVDRFKDLSVKDDLYNLRFFDIDTLETILEASGIKFKRVKYEKFGGPVDRLYGFGKKIPVLMPLARWLVPRLYRYQAWSKVERIAVIMELEKF